MIKMISEQSKKEQNSKVELMATMIENGIKSALKGVEKLVSTRFRKTLLTDNCIRTILGDGSELRKELETGAETEDIWKVI